MRKAKKMTALLLACTLVPGLTACGAAADGAAAPANAPAATATPAADAPKTEPETVTYDGPLYDITYERMTDTVPYFRTFVFSPTDVKGLILRQNFAWDDLYSISETYHTIGSGEAYSIYRHFCDANLNPVPVVGDYDFLASYNGKYLFRYNDGTYSSAGRGLYNANYYVQLFDENFDLAYDSTNEYDLFYNGPCHIYMESGRMAGVKHNTDEYGFFDLNTQEWHPVGSEYKTAGYGEMNYNGYSFYSDGAAVVAYLNSPYEKTYAVSNSMMRHTDSEMAGFIDMDGNWLFQFRDLPQFDGQVVNSTTGYRSGECMISTRSKDELVTEDVGSNMLLDRDHIYKIDKQGNILEEADYDAFVEFFGEVLAANHQHNDFATNSECNYHVDSVQIADGLTLRAVNPVSRGTIMPKMEANQYELVDANGNTYPLGIDSPEIVLVGDNGVVLIKSNEYDEAEPENIDGVNPYEDNGYRVWYKLKLESLMPEDYRVPQGQEQNLEPPAGAPLAEEMGLQEQDVYLSGAAEMRDVVLHLNYNGASLDYEVTPDDYESYYWEDDEGNRHDEPAMTQIMVGFYFIQEEMNTIPDVTVDWNDNDGNPHHGTYTEYGVTEE